MSEPLPGNTSATPPSAPDLETCLDGYARVLVEHGLGLRPGQPLHIWGELAHRQLALRVGQAAYEAGAGMVSFHLDDPLMTEQILRYGTPYQIDQFCVEREARLINILHSGAAFLAIDGKSDPDRMARLHRAYPKNQHHLIREWQKTFQSFVRRVTEQRLCPAVLAPGPTPGWATRVWPEESENEAHRRLAEHLWRFASATVASRDRLRACRLALDALAVRRIHIRGGGNDLEIGLSDQARWLDVGFETHAGQRFLFNVPSFEVFTTPDRRTAAGRLAASRPIRLPDGERVDGLELELRHGRVVRFTARVGEAALLAWLDLDDGARFLGEIALVADSPIAHCQRVFENTLVDENAASHVALGNGIREALAEDLQASTAALDAIGFNRSALHLDIPFGSVDVEIAVHTAAGRRLTLFQDDRWTDAWQEARLACPSLVS